MRVRVLRLRLLAGTAALLWAVAAVAVLIAYRPEGPLAPLVAATPAAGLVSSVAALAWPPLVRGRRVASAVAWLGIAELLVLAPSVGGLIDTLDRPSVTPLLPSPEAAYGWFLALAGSALFAGLGVSRRVLGATSLHRTRLSLAALVAVATLAVGSGISGVAALATELGQAPSAAATDWGPVDSGVFPPVCAAPVRVPASAMVAVRAVSEVDGRQLGSVMLTGVRSGTDESFHADLAGWPASGPGAVSSLDYARVGNAAWLRVDGRPWTPQLLPQALTIPVEAGVPQPSPRVRDRETLDSGAIDADLDDPARLAAEDVGIEIVGGARARHCRLLTGGILALQGFRPLRWLIGQPPMSDTPDLGAWRGELDWWVFEDAEVGMMTVSVQGLPTEWPPGWPAGLKATLTATLTARHRGSPVTVTAPAP